MLVTESRTVGANGAGAVDNEDQVIRVLRDATVKYTARLDALKAEVAQVAIEAKRYQKALAALTGEASVNEAEAKPKPKGKPRQSSVSHERMLEIERLVRRFGQDEFRPVDIRTQMNPPASSSSMSTAFGNLRQANVIRLARRNGTSRFYRLTREALRVNDSWLQEYDKRVAK